MFVKSQIYFFSNDCLDLLDSVFSKSYFLVMELFLDRCKHFGSGYSLSTDDLPSFRDISG